MASSKATAPGTTARSAGKADRAGPAGRRKLNRAGRPTLEELERRKLKVMKVATDMFVSRGYAGTTLLDIAKKAGVATRTLYQHFGDKEAIFREVIFARDTAVVAPPVLEPGDDLDTALHRAARYSLEVALKDRSIELMRLMIAESARFPELMSKVATAIFARFKSNVAALFQQLAEAGLIPKGDHAESASLFVDLLLGNQTVMIYFGWGTKELAAEEIERKLDLFVRGRFGEEYLPARKGKGRKKR